VDYIAIQASKRAVELGPDAVRHFKALKAAERARLKTAMLAALGDDDPAIENQNRFRLRRPSGQFEFEFRDGALRIFYRVEDDQVLVTPSCASTATGFSSAAGR